VRDQAEGSDAVGYRGLDACGELVTSATPAQLTSVLDLDLWRRAQPGRDEQFDVNRFGEWLEVLVDTGDPVAADTVAALDKQMLSTLADRDCVDADIQRGLRTLGRTLVQHRLAGTPWLAREAADALAMLDLTAWIGVPGLLDECPILPAALTAVLERRTTSVSATAFEFISTTAQIGDIRRFMRTLPNVLSR
jgi:hypothetical protein